MNNSRIETKLISIVVPIYNVEKYLEKCIKSLVNQTYKNLEILLIDDGSTDGSFEICKRFAKNDKRIVPIHKENGGYGSVLEYAIKNMNGEMFLICDPDDWLEKEAVEKLYSEMIINKADLTFGDKYIKYLGNENKELDVLIKNTDKKNFNPAELLFISPSPHSKLYVTSLAKEITFPRKVSHTDFILYYVYLSRINSATYINEPLSNYLLDRPGNTANSFKQLSVKTFDSYIEVFDSTLKQISKDSKYHNIIIGRILLNMLKILLMIPKSDEQYIDKKNKMFNIYLNYKKYKSEVKKAVSMCTKNPIKKYLKFVLVDISFSKTFSKYLLNSHK